MRKSILFNLLLHGVKAMNDHFMKVQVCRCFDLEFLPESKAEPYRIEHASFMRTRKFLGGDQQSRLVVGFRE